MCKLICFILGVNEGNKPPNIDIEGKNTKAKSLSKAREVLFQAEAAEKIYWAALVSDDVKHPEWWPRPKVCHPSFPSLLFFPLF